MSIRVETFIETRETSKEVCPYRGGPFTGQGMGHSPLPWEISIPFTSPMFTDFEEKMEIPFTATIDRYAAVIVLF